MPLEKHKGSEEKGQGGGFHLRRWRGLSEGSNTWTVASRMHRIWSCRSRRKLQEKIKGAKKVRNRKCSFQYLHLCLKIKILGNEGRSSNRNLNRLLSSTKKKVCCYLKVNNFQKEGWPLWNTTWMSLMPMLRGGTRESTVFGVWQTWVCNSALLVDNVWSGHIIQALWDPAFSSVRRYILHSRVTVSLETMIQYACNIIGVQKVVVIIVILYYLGPFWLEV